MHLLKVTFESITLKLTRIDYQSNNTVSYQTMPNCQWSDMMITQIKVNNTCIVTARLVKDPHLFFKTVIKN